EIRPAKFLDHLSGIRQRAAVDIEPHIIAETRGLDHERVAIPMTNRVAIPPRLHVFGRQRASIRKDLANPGLRLIKDRRHGRRLNNLARLRMLMQLHKTERQAVSVRIILAVLGFALLQELSCRGLERETALKRIAKIREIRVGYLVDRDEWRSGSSPGSATGACRGRRTTGSGSTRCRGSTRGSGRSSTSACGATSTAPSATAIFPDAREVGVSIGRARSRALQVWFSVGRFGNVRRRVVGPLRGKYQREHGGKCGSCKGGYKNSSSHVKRASYRISRRWS